MATRRRTGGRTTPKGTTNSSQSNQPKSDRPAAGRPNRSDMGSKNFDAKRQWVPRPETHNRGNR